MGLSFLAFAGDHEIGRADLFRVTFPRDGLVQGVELGLIGHA
jgi:hypothetical protein